MPTRHHALRHFIARIERNYLPAPLTSANQYTRARVFLWGLWGGSVFTVCGLSLRIAIDHGSPREYIATSIIAVALAAPPLLVRWGLSFALSTILTYTVVLSALVLAATELGGVWSMYAVSILPLPAFAALSGNNKTSLASLFLAICAFFVLLLGNTQGALLPPNITTDASIQHATTLIIIMVSLFGFVALHEQTAARALKRQQASEARYARVLNATQDGIFEWFPDRIARSQTFCDHLGCAPSALPHHTLIPASMLDPTHHTRYQGAVDACWEHHTPIDLELKLTTADGTERWFHLRADHAPEQDADATGHILGTLRDISKRKHMERRRTDFVSMVSHEIRTPLTSIQGAIGLVQGGALGEIAPPVHQTLALAARNTERLNKLVEDLIDLKRLDNDKLDIRFESVPLDTIVAQSVALNADFARRFGASLQLGEIPRDVHIKADPGRLHQILSNLLSNAIKHSPSEAPVVLSASVQSDGPTRHVCIHIQDRGPGIPADVRANMFGRFVQSELRPAAEGVGLGLHISHMLTQRMHGELTFESSAETGTRFTVALPAAPTPKPAPPRTTLEMPKPTLTSGTPTQAA